MDKYAIIKIGPFQYTVEEGKEYSVPNFEAKTGKMNAEQVLAVANGKDLEVGKPTVAKTKVVLNIIGEEKGEKITSKVYKAKSRYRKTRGFRKTVTRFKVESIA